MWFTVVFLKETTHVSDETSSIMRPMIRLQMHDSDQVQWINCDSIEIRVRWKCTFFLRYFTLVFHKCVI